MWCGVALGMNGKLTSTYDECSDYMFEVDFLSPPLGVYILTFFMVSDYICQEDEVKLIDEDETIESSTVK